MLTDIVIYSDRYFMPDTMTLVLITYPSGHKDILHQDSCGVISLRTKDNHRRFTVRKSLKQMMGESRYVWIIMKHNLPSLRLAYVCSTIQCEAIACEVWRHCLFCVSELLSQRNKLPTAQGKRVKCAFNTLELTTRFSETFEVSYEPWFNFGAHLHTKREPRSF